jgi:uncharacterized protein
VTMVSASSAQREPSMEEILASIRRIIEDNDAGRKPTDFDPEQPVGSTVIEVDAFRAELRAQPAEVRDEKWPEADERKPASLAGIQAETAAEDRRAASSRWTPETTPRPRFMETPQPRAAVIQAGPAESTQDTDPAAVPETETDAGLKPLPGLVPAAEPSASEALHARSTILSEHAGRKVAAAFGELSDAFAARSRKTFDELAEKMLQPMLQDWLDNNLPGLVERLVREEIERVARGS